MKKLFIVAFIFFGSSNLSAYSNKISDNIRQAVRDNRNARSLLEWENSSVRPENLFAQWRLSFMFDSSKRAQLSNEVCAELAGLDELSLSVFENEIEAEENRAILSPCKKELQGRLDFHYQAQRIHMSQVSQLWGMMDVPFFRFPPNVQTRDVSKGYSTRSADLGPRQLILTFDDGPSTRYTESILKTLKEVNAKAIFFHLGKNVRLNPDIVKKVAADGHAVASHSMSHSCLGTSRICRANNGRVFSFSEAIAEIAGGHQAVYDVLGWVEPFFRFPYGEASPELTRFLATNGTGELYWNIDSEDWKAQSHEDLISNTLAQIEAKGRGMVLFHDIQRRTAEALPQFLQEVYKRGYSIVLLQPSDPAARFNSKLVKKKLP